MDNIATAVRGLKIKPWMLLNDEPGR
jgi:hypothetical protein